jgi:hypothetical protein
VAATGRTIQFRVPWRPLLFYGCVVFGVLVTAD